MTIYIKAIILKLENKLKNILEILFFVYYSEHVKFQEASINSNWDIKRWNNTFTSPSKRWNKKFWINTDFHVTQYTMKQKLLDQYFHLTQYTMKHKVLDQHLHLTH